ncbi:YqeG family HAD IIIA-type phosphatase [Merismopedia glauca]|uniref:YqeG family HAD IIIA-type phosphatase n=1 Tax=Merismopedia glauca CCAP 1448/3 TaxID=1296344 RepID=A0A2T1C3Y0_9CYAN|nr:YqeG family HAD IIIA-type phosphatase [Merismopedia glauca]PSB02959.1 YqeG family HAD IIIA-type phosphatase [Merismopedia glauca CCAP 1448/3]
MSWGAKLQPDLVLGGTILKLTPEILEKHQLKGLILDVDETLVPITSPEASESLLIWVQQMRQVASLWLVSNNISETRIGRIAKAVNLPYLIAASKPSRRKLKQAAEAMALPVEQIAMVGDRLFTDVLAGNRLGMFTILVEPMVDPTMAVRSYPVRNLEVLISQALGVSLQSNLQKYTKKDNS